MSLKRAFQSLTIIGDILNAKLVSLLKKNTKTEDAILLIKTDIVGDYIVFRNYINFFKESTRYKNKKIYLLANASLKSLVSALDEDIVSNIIWIDYTKFRTTEYRRKFLHDLTKQKFFEVIVFQYSRTIFTEIAAFCCNARNKTAMGNDYTWLSTYTRFFTDKIYSKLISIPAEYQHEFQKNGFFAQSLTNIPMGSIGSLPTIEAAKLATGFSSAKQKYILISSGATDNKRRLPDKKLTSVVGFFLSKGRHIYFTGTANNKQFVEDIKTVFSTYSEQIVDLISKTSLAQMLDLVSHADAVVTNESGMYHVGVALRKPVICFAGGGHFNRWANYGADIENINLIYNKMPCFNCDWKCIYTVQKDDSYPCIQSIAEESVLNAINKTCIG